MLGNMVHVNEKSLATHTCIHKWNESRPTTEHFGWYSFPIPLKVGCWVGLVDSFACPNMDTHASSNIRQLC